MNTNKNIVKHEKIFEGVNIFHLTDKVGRIWQTIGRDEKDAVNVWSQGEDTFTFIVRDIKPETLSVEFLIKSLNIPRSAIIVVTLMHEVLNTSEKREEFYAETLGFNAKCKYGSKDISKVLFKMKKQAEDLTNILVH
ncbi:hypothetical protein [Paenibacillus tianjinensis]|uniref:Uncharacterized protein n=1 Tax=Paenibacillus tianjinensis TaxID=2810347 RepID=A0ABX7L5E7_9BACL|nr:hypothetical protein [Paenibacillus tianjinensis]QSF43295.1 hypothetical protein JRJ22_18685 [Paenibacillus tianjinensis]